MRVVCCLVATMCCYIGCCWLLLVACYLLVVDSVTVVCRSLFVGRCVLVFGRRLGCVVYCLLFGGC